MIVTPAQAAASTNRLPMLSVTQLPKPKMYRCLSTRAWCCVYDEVEGRGTTRRHAYVQWRTLYRKLRLV